MKITLKKIILSSLSLLLVLFIVLVVHIATAKPVEIDNATIQISRIDFNESLDSLKIKQINKHLESIPGIVSKNYNIENKTMVYFHDNKIIDANGVYEKLIQLGKYNASLYQLPEDLKNKQVCPVIKQGSFSYHFSRGVQRLFK